jgi:signal transduction histidine kinase
MLHQWLGELVQLVTLSLAAIFLLENYRLGHASKHLYLALAFGSFAVARYGSLIIRTPHLFDSDPSGTWWLPVFGQVAESLFFFLFWLGVVKRSQIPAVNEQFLTSFLSRRAMNMDRDAAARKSARWERAVMVAGTAILGAFAFMAWHLFRTAPSRYGQFWGDALFTSVNIVFISGILVAVGFSGFNWRQIWGRNALYLVLFGEIAHVVSLAAFGGQIPALQAAGSGASFLGFVLLALCHMRLGLQAKVAVALFFLLAIPGLVILVAICGGSFADFARLSHAAFAPWETTRMSFLRLLYLLIGTVAATAGFFGYLFARRLIVPLDNLADGTEAVAHGHLLHHVSSKRKDEYGDLARRFNLMTCNLRAGICELKEVLRRTREAYRRDIDIQREILISGKLELQRLSLVGRIASRVADQLHSHSDSVFALMKEVLRDYEKHSPDNERARTLLSEADRLAAMQERFSNLTKTDLPSFMPLDVNCQIQNVVELIEPQFREHNIQIRLDLGQNIGPIFGAAEELQQVFLNLALNAKDAMPTGGVLRIRSRRTDYPGRESRVEIEFSDTGIGIPEQWLSKIFDPFFTRKLRQKRPGLGLAISRAIVESHGGSISVRTKQGEGSTFAIWLPSGERNEGENMSPHQQEEEEAHAKLPFPGVTSDRAPNAPQVERPSARAGKRWKSHRRLGIKTGRDSGGEEIHDLPVFLPDAPAASDAHGPNGTAKSAQDIASLFAAEAVDEQNV